MLLGSVIRGFPRSHRSCKRGGKVVSKAKGGQRLAWTVSTKDANFPMLSRSLVQLTGGRSSRPSRRPSTSSPRGSTLAGWMGGWAGGVKLLAFREFGSAARVKRHSVQRVAISSPLTSRLVA